MSWSKGLKFERYLKLFSTPVSPSQPKYIGVDESWFRCSHDPSESCLIVAAYSNNPSVLGRNDLGERGRGSGFYMNEIPPVNFNYLVIPSALFEMVRMRNFYPPQSRPEESANGNFQKYMLNIDGTAFLLSTIMGPHDIALIHGYWRPQIVQEKLTRKLVRLGREPEYHVRCRSCPDFTVPALRAADNIGYRLRNRLDDFPEQKIEFAKDDLLAMNLDRHALREFRKSDEIEHIGVNFDAIGAQTVPV